jgi:hypothetical protein
VGPYKVEIIIAVPEVDGGLPVVRLAETFGTTEQAATGARIYIKQLGWASGSAFYRILDRNDRLTSPEPNYTCD